MSKIIPGSNLTVYERWEMPSVDSPLSEDEQTSSVTVPRPQTPTPPTLEEIESIQRLAQEEGFSSGYQEGRKEGKEQGYGKGHQEGYEKGFLAGYEAGMVAGQGETVERIQRLEQILNFMSHPLNNLDNVVEQELVHLSIAIARQLIRRELKATPDEIVAVVRHSLKLLPVGSRDVHVHLHPEDAAIIREVYSLRGEGQSWQIQEDPTLTRGGCRVETELSTIDATVERRLGAVIAMVLGDERKDGGQHTDQPEERHDA